MEDKRVLDKEMMELVSGGSGLAADSFASLAPAKQQEFLARIEKVDVDSMELPVELLDKINKEFGITIVIITHQMSVVREVCRHVAILKNGEVVEQGLVSDIFTHPKTDVAKELIRKDIGNEAEVEKTAAMQEIQSGEIIRIVFSDNSAFEPVIANLILTFHEPVNILRANTRNVGGVAKGEMVLQFMEYSQNTEAMKHYLEECGLAVEEAPEYAH